ncbi:hypothetical protein EI94DRAFT_1794599 [Lactarius quietus]|nr:hypothetical protein EI94DRAFT_1794599 [Lactarius quietus]
MLYAPQVNELIRISVVSLALNMTMLGLLHNLQDCIEHRTELWRAIHSTRRNLTLSACLFSKYEDGSSTLQSDNKSLIGEYVEYVDRESWILEFVPGGAHIKSKANGLYVGFEGDAKEGVKVIVGNHSIAKVWDIKPDHPPDYKVKLHDSPFVLEFPKNNLHPGTNAQLGRDHGEETNQIWVITKGIVVNV